MLGAFVPREHDYAKLVTERGGFYGADCPLEMFFEGGTKEQIRRFIRQFCETEISVELIRQKIMNKLSINPEAAFNAIDHD